jgi:predicted TIM-barrel fold metal-dependent hydrolase
MQVSQEPVASKRTMGGYEGPVIDSDVHHTWPNEGAVIEYLPKAWQEYVKQSGNSGRPRHVGLEPAMMLFPHINGPNKRLDTFPSSGGPPGSDYETFKKQLLDPFNIERAILSFDTGANSVLQNLYFASEVVRAANDWNIDHWLSRSDDRLYSVVIVPSQVPEEAAREVRRVGKHPRIAEVLLVGNGLRKPFGHPLYHPIYEAAADMGLPVAIHTHGQGGNQSVLAGGPPNSRLEAMAVLSHCHQHYLHSFIVHGVFEKFPNLQLLLVEGGVAWLPDFVWAMDAHYDLLRHESPWVRRWPSEYVHDHVRLTTQPLEVPDEPGRLVDLIESLDGMEDLLCFATDYPHWDADDPTYIARHLRREWLPKLFYENARAVYGWA